MDMNKEKKDEKEYFTVKVEGLVPATLTYKVYAASPEEAVDIVKSGRATIYEAPKLKLGAVRFIKATAYTAGTTIIRWVKNFR